MVNNPQTYNEKLNWLKVFYHNPKMHIIADKAKFGAYVQTRLPELAHHIIKPLAIFHSSRELTRQELSKLPDRFVLKSNFGSGAQEFVDKHNVSLEYLQDKMKRWLNPATNHYFMALEYGYKDIKPAVICEPIINFEYKIEFYCFDGEPEFYWIVLNDKASSVRANLYSMDGIKLPVSWHYLNFDEEVPQPPYFAELVNVSKKLSAGFPHVRVDFYAAKNTWYFSEMIFYTWAGLMPFSDPDFDRLLGNKLNLKRWEE